MELGEEKEEDIRLSNNINCLMLERCYVDLVELGNYKRSARSVEESYWSFNSVKDLFLPARGPYQDFQEYRIELVLMIKCYEHFMSIRDNNVEKTRNSQRRCMENEENRALVC
jgi:hypothetical protein